MVQEKYNELLKLYMSKYGRTVGRSLLEDNIRNLMKQLSVDRERTVEELYRREVEKPTSAKPVKERVIMIEGIEAYIKYDGKDFGIIYLKTPFFTDDLPRLGRVLDYVNESLGEVICIVPNLGFTPTATSAGAVKGCVIIYRKKKAQQS